MAKPKKDALDENEPQETERIGKQFYLRQEYAIAFNVLAARQGPRSGPRLIEEAINLLLKAYGEKPLP